jgi:hypothetical protein
LFGRTGHAESIARQVVAVTDMQVTGRGGGHESARRKMPPGGLRYAKCRMENGCRDKELAALVVRRRASL